MKAAVYDRYGPPDVVRIRDVAPVQPGAGEVMVRVAATSVTTADWRMRAAAFPGITKVPGYLMLGIRRPRKRVLGGDFAGTIEARGAGVTRFALGDRVFGFSGMGAHAEALVMRETGPIAHTPESLTDVEAAAVPFGALTALVFLRDIAKVKPGHRVLLIGASGGVGCYATQIARYLGAGVDGVCGPENLDLVRTLGADAHDYTIGDFTATDRRYDAILDITGVSTFARCRPLLAPDGVFVPLNVGTAREIGQALWAGLRRSGPRMVIGGGSEKQQDLETIADLLRRGTIRPVIDRVYPFAGITCAHTHVESRHRRGSVVVTLAPLPD